MDKPCSRVLIWILLLGVTCLCALPLYASAAAATEGVPPQAQGPGDKGLAISRDGRTAYVSFTMADAVFAVDLATMTTRDTIDVSAAGPQLSSQQALLSLDGKSLYVASFVAQKLMVIDTATNRLTATLPLRPSSFATMAASADGKTIYVPSSDGSLYSVSTADQSYTRLYLPGVYVGPIAASSKTPGVVYTAGAKISQAGSESTFFAINVTTGIIVRSGPLPADVIAYPTTPRKLVLSQDETLAYFGWLRQASNKGAGNLVVFDLNNYRVMASVPADCGVADFVVHEASAKIYVIGFWSGSGTGNVQPILEFDLGTNRFVRSIPLELSSDMGAIASDPTNPDILYETDSDHSFLRKVQISTGTEIGRLQFTWSVFNPRAILSNGGTGYVLGKGSKNIFKMDLESGQLLGKITVPVSSPLNGGGFYQDRLYFKVGTEMLALNPSDGSIAQRYQLGLAINPGTFAFFGDRMAAIDYVNPSGGGTARQVVIFDARTMALLKAIPLEVDLYSNKIVASPDGSKLYIARGSMSGQTTVITIISGTTLDVVNTIAISPTSLSGGTTDFLEGEFDEVRRTLYLLGFMSVYKIDMDTDRLTGTLDLTDIFTAWGRKGWSPTGLVGVALSPTKDKLFVAAGDSHTLYWYNFTTSAWSTRTTDLMGYFPVDAVASPNRRYMFTVNQQSDSVSMMDLTSGELVKVIVIPGLKKAP